MSFRMLETYHIPVVTVMHLLSMMPHKDCNLCLLCVVPLVNLLVLKQAHVEGKDAILSILCNT